MPVSLPAVATASRGGWWWSGISTGAKSQRGQFPGVEGIHGQVVSLSGRDNRGQGQKAAGRHRISRQYASGAGASFHLDGSGVLGADGPQPGPGEFCGRRVYLSLCAESSTRPFRSGGGVGSRITSLAIPAEAEWVELMSVSDGYGLAAVMTMGYPEWKATRLSRHPVESFARRESFDGPPLTNPL